ncbi:MAG: hypothetical protein KKA42_13625, partial [candidate division Zixibacteria bacterium]|nr:hypothetical protein [candidate division Zixibacteria bacterium]
MDTQKNRPFAPIRLTIILGLLLVLSSVTAEASDWENLTSYRQVRQMRTINGAVYMATSGGMQIVSNPYVKGQCVCNLDGLGISDIRDIMQAEDGQIWVAGSGMLVKYDGLQSVRYPFEHNDGRALTIHCLRDDGDSLWVGLDTGVVLFSKAVDDGQIEDYYWRFGDLNPAPDVYGIEVVGDSIWLATSVGLVVADKTNPQLLYDKNAWRTYTPESHPELESGIIRDVVMYDASIYIGTPRGAYRLDGGTDTFVKIPYATTADFTSIKVEDGLLYIYSAAGAAVVTGGGVTPLASDGLPGAARTGTVGMGVRWVGLTTGGVYHDAGGTFEEYLYTGLPDDNVSDASVGVDGVLTVLCYKRGPYELRDDLWVQRPILVGNRAELMVTDRYGWNWIGTYGAGVSRVGDTVAHYDNWNSSLQGALDPNDTTYIVCEAIAVSDNHVFAASTWAYQNRPIAIGDLTNLDSPSGWTTLGSTEGITDHAVFALDYYNNTLAIGSNVRGVFTYYLGPDPFDTGDDHVTHFTETNSFLISDIVRAVRFSPGGELWIGTNRGVSRYDAGVERLVDVNLPGGFGPDVTAICFDGRSNVWLGATNGLAFRDAVTGDFTVYSTDNSDLIDNAVKNLYIDAGTGDLYVATPRGLSIKKANLGPPTDDVESVYAIPNPFVVRSTNDSVRFNFAEQASLRIFTVAGELVAEMERPSWDGRNQSGYPVASGVYLFV